MGRQWKTEDEQFLIDNYSNFTSNNDLAKLLGRNPRALSVKAHKLGLKAKSRTRKSFVPQRYSHLTDIEKGYIAGLIDGEGSIINETDDKGITRLRVVIANNDRNMLYFVRERLQGNIYFKKPKVPNPKHKDSYMWVLSGSLKVKQLLEVITPFLITKKERAEKALEYKSLWSQ